MFPTAYANKLKSSIVRNDQYSFCIFEHQFHVNCEAAKYSIGFNETWETI